MLHPLGVSDIEHAAAFYDAAARLCQGLGRPFAQRCRQAVGYGTSGGGDKLAIKQRRKGQRPPGPGFHLAFAALDRQAVAAFHAAALAHGGTDNGGPGLRAHYGLNYFAAFVTDPDGHPIEAVFK